jgi:hypothetical protein
MPTVRLYRLCRLHRSSNAAVHKLLQYFTIEHKRQQAWDKMVLRLTSADLSKYIQEHDASHLHLYVGWHDQGVIVRVSLFCHFDRRSNSPTAVCKQLRLTTTPQYYSVKSRSVCALATSLSKAKSPSTTSGLRSFWYLSMPWHSLISGHCAATPNMQAEGPSPWPPASG